MKNNYKPLYISLKAHWCDYEWVHYAYWYFLLKVWKDGKQHDIKWKADKSQDSEFCDVVRKHFGIAIYQDSI